METKTIKLCNHNLEAEFYLQINGANTKRLIAGGKERGYWRNLFDFYVYSRNSWIWKTEPSSRKYLMQYPSLMNNTRRAPEGNVLYLEWVEEVFQNTTGMFTKDECVFVQGSIEEIVT
jgi:hypothetical protein